MKTELLLSLCLKLLADYDRAAKGALTFAEWNRRRAELIRELANENDSRS